MLSSLPSVKSPKKNPVKSCKSCLKKRSRFFRNQDKLKETAVQDDLNKTLSGADAIILAVQHRAYLELDPASVVEMTGNPAAIVDCFGILNDAAIKRYFELGCERSKVSGRGHVKRIKDAVRDSA